MAFDDIQSMNTSELTFDLENPRLAEFNLPQNPEEANIIQVLWDMMDVRELVLSIAASGFFQHEPLIVTQEKGKNIVIEGNRRLAAVKILIKPELIETPKGHIPNIGKRAKREIRRLPTVLSTREKSWRYIGFKHVNGPAKWGSYAKSEYIAKVNREFGVSLEDIAMQIGDTHQTVQKLFRGIMVIEQAERMKVFDRNDRWQRHFSFSHIYTGLGYKGINTFIGLRSESEEEKDPVPHSKKSELEELFLWLYGSRSKETQPVVRTQNPDLRNLNAVVMNREAIAALRTTRNLDHAHEISRPSSNVFEESLHDAKRSLQKAHSLLSTGYDGSETLRKVAGDIANLADDLFEEMGRKQSRLKSRRGERAR
ncbi:MAG: hypothetical protein F4X94_04110 [Dehalococcoidia bacterium]|nr:hypothetical protein [Dehalococcoidia bacterium]